MIYFSNQSIKEVEVKAIGIVSAFRDIRAMLERGLSSAWEITCGTLDGYHNYERLTARVFS